MINLKFSLFMTWQMFMGVSVAPLMEKLTSAEMESHLENGVNIKEFVKESCKLLKAQEIWESCFLNLKQFFCSVFEGQFEYNCHHS